MEPLFSNKVSPEFLYKVKDISYSLGIDPSWLMFVMDYESGLSPSIQNSINATGLIQFLPSTAQDLGTTVDALKNMSAVDQLDYVYSYMKNYKGKMDDYYSTYLAVFYPVAIGQADTYVFPSDVVRSNPSFFKTGNTLADFKKGLDAIVYQRVPTDYYGDFLKKKEIFCKSIKRTLYSLEQLEFYS